MKALNSKATRMIEKLVAAADANGGSIKLSAPGFMDLCIERLGANEVSLAHYYFQNGDAMSDPDMTFWLGPDSKFYPTSITMSGCGMYRRSVNFADGKVVSFYPAEQKSEATFANQWLANIAMQGHARSI